MTCPSRALRTAHAGVALPPPAVTRRPVLWSWWMVCRSSTTQLHKTPQSHHPCALLVGEGSVALHRCCRVAKVQPLLGIHGSLCLGRARDALDLLAVYVDRMDHSGHGGGGRYVGVADAGWWRELSSLSDTVFVHGNGAQHVQSVSVAVSHGVSRLAVCGLCATSLPSFQFCSCGRDFPMLRPTRLGSSNVGASRL